MDLKSIFEQENHGVGTTLMGYDFYISPERNIYKKKRKKSAQHEPIIRQILLFLSR